MRTFSSKRKLLTPNSWYVHDPGNRFQVRSRSLSFVPRSAKGKESSVGLEDERARAVDIVDIVDTETVDTDEAGRAVAVDVVDTDGAVAVDVVDTDGAVAVDTDEAGRAVAVDNETVDTGSDGAVAVDTETGRAVAVVKRALSASGGSDHEDIAMRLPPFAFVTHFFMLDV